MKAHPGAVNDVAGRIGRGARRGPPRSRPRVPPPVSASALRRPAAARRHWPWRSRAGRASSSWTSRPRVSTSRRSATSSTRCAASARPTVSPASTSAMTSPWWAGSSRRSPSCTPGVSSSSGRPRGSSEIRFTPTRGACSPPSRLPSAPSSCAGSRVSRRGRDAGRPDVSSHRDASWRSPAVPQPQPLIEVADRQVRCWRASEVESRGAVAGRTDSRAGHDGRIRARGGRPQGQLRAGRGAARCHDEDPRRLLRRGRGRVGIGQDHARPHDRRPAHQLHRESHVQRLPTRSRA